MADFEKTIGIKFATDAKQSISDIEAFRKEIEKVKAEVVALQKASNESLRVISKTLADRKRAEIEGKISSEKSKGESPLGGGKVDQESCRRLSRTPNGGAGRS